MKLEKRKVKIKIDGIELASFDGWIDGNKDKRGQYSDLMQQAKNELQKYIVLEIENK